MIFLGDFYPDINYEYDNNNDLTMNILYIY